MIISMLGAFALSLVAMFALIAFYAVYSSGRVQDPDERARIEDLNSFDVTIFYPAAARLNSAASDVRWMVRALSSRNIPVSPEMAA